MLDKKNLLLHIKEETLKGVMLKVIDKTNTALRGHEVKYTDFLTPHEVKISSDILNKIRDIKYTVAGGYEEAERKILIIFPDYLENCMIDIPLALLEIKGRSQFEKLDHRDYLGAILGLGLKREKIGDLIVHGNTCQAIIDSELKDYILFQLNNVGNVPVIVKELKLNEIIPPSIEYKSINGNVASLRLDAVLSLAFKISRVDAQNLILKDRVSINWGQITKPSCEVAEKDIISVKGKGRLIVTSIEGRTKSDRIIIRLHKPI